MIVKATTTAKEFEAVSGQYGPCELVRGEVVRLSPAGSDHSSIAARITTLLFVWAKSAGSGRVLSGEAGVVVETNPDTVRGMDVAYVSHQRLRRDSGRGGFLTIAPDLAVEIVGRGQGWADLVEKAGEYLRMGVDRVWVIDPKTRRVHVFRADTEPAAFSEDNTLTDETILPGFSCKVADFFKD